MKNKIHHQNHHNKIYADRVIKKGEETAKVLLKDLRRNYSGLIPPVKTLRDFNDAYRNMTSLYLTIISIELAKAIYSIVTLPVGDFYMSHIAKSGSEGIKDEWTQLIEEDESATTPGGADKTASDMDASGDVRFNKETNNG